MRKVFMIVALVLALLGAIGGRSASSSTVRSVTTHMQSLAAGTPDAVICGGAASTYCG